MPFVLFHSHFPEIAERETRTLAVLEDSALGLPAALYSLLDMYCDEPRCDCRRVFLSVMSSLTANVEAVIAYGWESPEFYARWLGDDDPTMIEELRGPVLNLGSPQSKLAPAILQMVEGVALQDNAYVERLKAHYRIFRNKIDKRQTATVRKKK